MLYFYPIEYGIIYIQGGCDMDIIKLWNEGNASDWDEALDAYYETPSVKRNQEVEKLMDSIDSNRIREMSVQDFYLFLHDEYFVWKYTAKNRLATTRKQLEKYEAEGMSQLEKAQKGIFRAFDEDPEDTEELLYKATRIYGLGTAGASGLLAVLFPEYYGTVDQFLVYALRKLENLPEYATLERMNPEGLTIKDGIVLEDILRRKTKELNEKFATQEWTPKKVDMILWTYRDE
jgi:hypothetical protein